MIKRCAECGGAASSALKVEINGKEQDIPSLCSRCKSHIVSKIKRVISDIKTKEVTVVKRLGYEQ